MARVFTKQGTYGPRNDPYGWEEVTFIRTDGTKVMIFIGSLGDSVLTVNGKRELQVRDGSHTCENRFEELTGIRPDQAEHYRNKAECARIRKLPRHEQHIYWAMREADSCMMRYAL